MPGNRLIRWNGIVSAAAFTLLAATAPVAAAQTAGANTASADARWQPWLGCWIAETPSATDASAGMVCLVPESRGSGVELVVIAKNAVTHRERFDASGERVTKDFDGCPGWESATFSRDERRVLFRSQFTCGKTTVQGSGVFAISENREWIDVSGSVVGGQSTVRAVRYRPAGRELRRLADAVASDAMPFDVVTERPALRYARIDAGRPVRTDAVLEVAKQVAPTVAEAWVHELQQGFELNGKELTRLADAGLPSSLIDLMVAQTYPERFQVTRAGEMSGGGIAISQPRSTSEEARLRRSQYCGYGYASMYPSYYDDPCNYGYPMYGGYWMDPFGYSRYGYGAYSGYGYGYGGYYGGYYWGPRPIVIVNGGASGNAPQRGRAVKGAGYTRGGGGSATPSRTDGGQSAVSGGSTRSSGSGSSAGSSSGSSSSGSSQGSSSGSSGRTAKPRPPG